MGDISVTDRIAAALRAITHCEWQVENQQGKYIGTVIGTDSHIGEFERLLKKGLLKPMGPRKCIITEPLEILEMVIDNISDPNPHRASFVNELALRVMLNGNFKDWLSSEEEPFYFSANGTRIAELEAALQNCIIKEFNAFGDAEGKASILLDEESQRNLRAAATALLDTSELHEEIAQVKSNTSRGK